MFSEVGRLRHSETACLDRDRLEELVIELGEPGAERYVGRALDTIAVRLNRCERARRSGDMARLITSAEELAGCAQQIGLVTLERVARDVILTARRGDEASLAATLSRMVRIGEASLMSAWDLGDMPG